MTEQVWSTSSRQAISTPKTAEDCFKGLSLFKSGIEIEEGLVNTFVGLMKTVFAAWCYNSFTVKTTTD